MRIRFPAGSLLFALGSLLFALCFVLFGLGSGDSAAAPIYKLVVPGISGDDASGETFGTPVPTTWPPTTAPTASPSATGTVAPGSCNYSRVAVKTLSDPAAGFGRTPQAVTVTLAGLLNRPVSVPESRVAGDETAVYAVPVSLTSVSRNAARELVLLVTDPANTKSMLIYFPHRDCIKNASTDDQVTLNKARKDFEDVCGEVPEFGAKQLRGQATVTGVAHWGDKSVPGAAPNGMELHPALKFEYNSTVSCDPGAVQPPPTPTPSADPTVQSITLSGVPVNIKPGDQITAQVRVSPVIEGVTCELIYYPATISLPRPSQNVGTVPLETDAFGEVSFTFFVPTPTSYDGIGAVDAECGTKSVRVFFFISPA